MTDRNRSVPDRAVRAEAAIWVARLHSDTRTDEDERSFRTWLEEKPDNRMVFERMTATWDAASALSPFTVQIASPPRMSRRRAIGGIGALAVGGAGFVAWNAAHAGIYETAIGEQREIALDDGSRLMLDTDTRVKVRLGTRVRHLSLQRGRLNLRIATDTARPFEVDAGERLIRAASGSIDVQRIERIVSIAVLKGDAWISAASAGDPHVARLAAGQRLIDRVGRLPSIDAPDFRQLMAWQSGKAVFDRTTLTEAAAEMNRYNIVKIGIEDPTVAEMTISGAYDVDDADGFAHSVASALSLQVERSGDYILIFSVQDNNLR